MHRIERYGVIALVLLLVTTAAVALWGSGADPTRDQAVLAAEKSAPPVSQTRLPAGRRATPLRAANPETTRREAPGRTLRATEGTQGGTLALSNREQRPDALAAARRIAKAPSRLVRGVAGTESPRPGSMSASSSRESALAPSGLVKATAAAAPAARVPSTRVVLVKAGDVLSLICQRELGTVRRMDEVLALNPGLDPDRLSIGQRLRMPVGEVAPGPAAGTFVTSMVDRSKVVAAKSAPLGRIAASQARLKAGAAATAPSGAGYTVRPGDVLGSIAQRELGSVRRLGEIVAASPGLDPDRLVVGQTLRMPSGTRAPSATSASAVARASVPAPRNSGGSQGRVR